MRVAIIVLMVLVAALAIYFVVAGTGHLQTAGFTAPPEKNGQPDKDAMETWTPPSVATALGGLVAPFAPHADLGTKSVGIDAGATLTLTAAPSSQKMQIAALQVGGGGLGISYPCTHGDGSDCSETACLCEPGASVSPLKISACPASFRDEVSGAGVCSAAAKEKTSIVIYPEAAKVSLGNLGPARITVSLQ